MEALLSARLKAVALFLVPLGLIVGAAILFFSQSRSLGGEEMYALISRNLDAVEGQVSREMERFVLRSSEVKNLQERGALRDEDLRPREALFSATNGVIRWLRGEIYYYRIEPLQVGRWTFIAKNQDIYRLRRLSQDLYYLDHFLDRRNNFILSGLRYPVALSELKFYPSTIQGRQEEFRYDAELNQYRLTRILRNLRGQFQLENIFTKSDFDGYFSKRNRRTWLLLFFLLTLYLLFIFRRRAGPLFWIVRYLLFLGLIATASFGLSLMAPANIYLDLKWFTLSHIHQVLALILALGLTVRLCRRFLPPLGEMPLLLLADALLLGSFFFGKFLLRGVNFPFSDFVFGARYLTLLLVLILLALSPYLVAGATRKRSHLRLLPILLQALFLLVCLGLGTLVFAIGLSFSIFVFLVAPKLQERSWLHLLMYALVAYSVTLFLYSNSMREKKEFISGNLKMVLSSQSHYAMMVAREIVYEINVFSRKKPFADFFGPQIQGELKSIWHSTLASKELIPSGIFIVSPTGEIMASYSFQIPFIKVYSKDRFPFWHEEEVYADLYGKKLNLALASISIYKDSQFMGDIVIQVVISPELILRNQDQTSIFSINQRLRDSGIGYIKVDPDNQILENPANITIENLAVQLKGKDRWIRFRYQGLSYEGYLFHHGENVVLIFFPRPTLFKTISEWIKLFLFLLLFFLLLNLRYLKSFDWNAYWRSFSVKVFLMLIVISMLTASVFSVFSLNFHFPALERQLVQTVYEKGRIAQNMISNLIYEKKDNISQNDLFMLSKILDNNLTLYEDGGLLYSSDNRRIILSQIPLYLPSALLARLQSSPLYFDQRRGAGSVHLYSKISPSHVLAVEFFYNISDQVRAKRYYLDFIISLFFFLFFIGLASALFFRNRILAPINALNRGMAEVERGSLEPLPTIPRETELQSLYQGFNSMIEGIREQKKNILELARMKTVIQLSRRLAHEIKNPLTPIKLSAEQIERSLHDKSPDYEGMIKKSLHFIVEEVEHLRKVSLGFLDLSKLERLQISEFDLVALVEQEVANLRFLFPQVQFLSSLPPHPVPVQADRTKIKQAVGNVLNNAIEACEAIFKRRSANFGEEEWRQKPAVEVTMMEAGEEEVQIEISDNGVGMGEKEREQMFEENYSSKETGIGLGLIIVKRIVELHRGSLEIESQENVGTRVKIRFAKHVPQA